jgi:dCMP deaminase
MSKKWNKRYLTIAKDVAKWSKDPSKKIGAVLVGSKGQIISQGYNGFPRGIEDTDERYDDRPTKYKYVVHAEANAIYNAIHNGSNTNNATIYVTGLPVCHECAKVIIQTGVSKVVMDTKPCNGWEESGNLAIDMLNEAGIEFEYCEELDDENENN